MEHYSIHPKVDTGICLAVAHHQPYQLVQKTALRLHWLYCPDCSRHIEPQHIWNHLHLGIWIYCWIPPWIALLLSGIYFFRYWDAKISCLSLSLCAYSLCDILSPAFGLLTVFFTKLPGQTGLERLSCLLGVTSTETESKSPASSASKSLGITSTYGRHVFHQS